MRRTSILIGSLATLASGSAQADWEYTKWGMTADQVAKASGGAVTVLPASEQVTSAEMRMTRKAEGTLTDGSLKLQVQFGFDQATGGLKLIAYGPSNPSQNEALHAWLVKRYGPPSDTDKLQRTTTLTWSRPDSMLSWKRSSIASKVSPLFARNAASR